MDPVTLGMAKADAARRYAPNPTEVSVGFSVLPTHLHSKVEANAVAFGRSNVVTRKVGDVTTQYAAWWDSHQNPVIGKRVMPDGLWSTYDLAGIPGNPLFAPLPPDGHNSLAIGIDADGRIHVAGNMHDVPLRYVRSTNPDDITQWTVGSMVGTNETSVTYPQFVRVGSTLLFFYRDGGAGNGDMFINRWTGTAWVRVVTIATGAGLTPVQSPYFCQPAVGQDGSLHVFAVWRVGASFTGTHDICHMKSVDNGVTWTSITGTPLTLPVAAPGSTGGTGSIMPIALAVTAGLRGLINQTGAGIDAAGRPHMATWMYSADNNTANTFDLHHVYWDGAAWVDEIVRSVTGRSGNTIGIARPAVVCTRDGRTLILWRNNSDNVLGSEGLFVTDVSPAPIRRSATFTLVNAELGGYEPSFDIDAARELNQLHMLVTPTFRDPNQITGDEIWSAQWGAIVSLDLTQLPLIAAGLAQVPGQVPVQSTSATGTTSSTTLSELSVPQTVVAGTDELILVRLVLAANAGGASTNAQVALHQKDVAKTKGVDLLRFAIANGPRVGRTTMWVPLRPDLADLAAGAMVVPRFASGVSGTLTIAGVTLEVNRLRVGTRKTAYTKPRGLNPATLGRWALGWRPSALGLADAAAVSTMPDASGGGRTWGQTDVAKQPTYRTAGINGAPSIRFDGGDILRTASTLVLGNTYTICTVASSSATPAGTQVILGADDSSQATVTRVQQLRYTANAAALSALTFGITTSGAKEALTGALSPSAATARVITIKRTYSTYGSIFELWINGVLAASNYTAHNYGQNTGVAFNLGGRISGGVDLDFLTGDIGDGDIWTSWLSEAEQRAAEQNLAEKYAITLP